MKQTILFIITFFTFLLSFSQKTGKVEYNFFVELSQEREELYKKLKSFEDVSFSEGAKKVSFMLEFKNADSKFYVVEGIELEDLDAELAVLHSGYQNVTYFSTIEKASFYNNRSSMLFDKEEFVIEKKAFDSWEFKNERKEIQGLVCYKATGFITESIKGGQRKKEIVAWYCPELPFSFGPNGYGGLPGLILELQVGEVLFGATNISLNEKIEDIDSTKLKGKRITAEEYSKILRERAGVIMEGR